MEKKTKDNKSGVRRLSLCVCCVCNNRTWSNSNELAMETASVRSCSTDSICWTKLTSTAAKRTTASVKQCRCNRKNNAISVTAKLLLNKKDEHRLTGHGLCRCHETLLPQVCEAGDQHIHESCRHEGLHFVQDKIPLETRTQPPL